MIITSSVIMGTRGNYTNVFRITRMKRLIQSSLMIVFFLLLGSVCVGQKDSSIAFRDMRSDGIPRVLKDPKTGVRYVLDSAHIYIEATNEHGKTIWKTDPWKDNKLPAYRTNRPIVVSIGIGKENWTDGKTAILLSYNNTQTGYIDLFTGKFTFVLQY
jgi:hypothetical protein